MFTKQQINTRMQINFFFSLAALNQRHKGAHVNVLDSDWFPFRRVSTSCNYIIVCPMESAAVFGFLSSALLKTLNFLPS